MQMSEAELVDRVIDWVRSKMQTGVPTNADITANTDLLASGLLDSLGLVDLILFIDSLNGCKVDLSDVDPSDFSVVRALCRIALRNGQECRA